MNKKHIWKNDDFVRICRMVTYGFARKPNDDFSFNKAGNSMLLTNLLGNNLYTTSVFVHKDKHGRHRIALTNET